MALALRDQRISNVSIDADKLIQINAVLEDRVKTINALVPQNSDKQASLSYIIRFDNKGYRVATIKDILCYFQQAKEVERVIFSLETAESMRTNRQSGTYLELRLDDKDQNACMITVASDDKDLVDASFSGVIDVLDKCKTKNNWLRTAWTPLLVQIIGAVLGFTLSLWAASKISPKLTIENSFFISFLFVLLIFSNTWTYAYPKILMAINALFPNLKFYRPGKERMHWLMRAVVGGIAVAVTLYILSHLFSFIGSILGGFINKRT